MKKINYTLPEFCFLDGNSHQGNTLEYRTVIQHVRSYSIFEAITLDDFKDFDFGKSKSYQFTFKNKFGVFENHMLVLHFSMTIEDDYILKDIFKKTAKWYCEYLTWEDNNITDEATANLN